MLLFVRPLVVRACAGKRVRIPSFIFIVFSQSELKKLAPRLNENHYFRRGLFVCIFMGHDEYSNFSIGVLCQLGKADDTTLWEYCRRRNTGTDLHVFCGTKRNGRYKYNNFCGTFSPHILRAFYMHFYIGSTLWYTFRMHFYGARRTPDVFR